LPYVVKANIIYIPFEDNQLSGDAMAWKRGVQNNQAGVIRKGHIKEFLMPSSKDASVSFKLKIVDHRDLDEDVVTLLHQSCSAHANFNYLSENIRVFIADDPSCLYIHAHDHPASVISLRHLEIVPPGVIALSESNRVNAKVCIGELQEWTIYQGSGIYYGLDFCYERCDLYD
jgi:hypothetical protein